MFAPLRSGPCRASSNMSSAKTSFSPASTSLASLRTAHARRPQHYLGCCALSGHLSRFNLPDQSLQFGDQEDKAASFQAALGEHAGRGDPYEEAPARSTSANLTVLRLAPRATAAAFTAMCSRSSSVAFATAFRPSPAHAQAVHGIIPCSGCAPGHPWQATSLTNPSERQTL